jgi:transglutaminase-like putative cysteine protease
VSPKVNADPGESQESHPQVLLHIEDDKEGYCGGSQFGHPYPPMHTRGATRPYAGVAHLMQIRVGYELLYDFPQPTPVLLVLNIHYSRVSDVVRPDYLLVAPSVPVGSYRDAFGNWCNRILAPAGRTRIWGEGVVNDTGLPEVAVPGAAQHPVQVLPEETLQFLLGSRYCDTERLLETAWQLFSATPEGWARVQAICDFVHQHIEFGYQHARPTKTAWEAYCERNGVCRDYTHLAITLCRCMNIPARYCTGYLGDIGMSPPYGPMDFAAWFEVYLGDRWHTFDARNNEPRIGRVLIARGRDAADVAIATTFGPNKLAGFRVWCDEVAG